MAYNLYNLFSRPSKRRKVLQPPPRPTITAPKRYRPPSLPSGLSQPPEGFTPTASQRAVMYSPPAPPKSQWPGKPGYVEPLITETGRARAASFVPKAPAPRASFQELMEYFNPTEATRRKQLDVDRAEYQDYLKKRWNTYSPEEIQAREGIQTLAEIRQSQADVRAGWPREKFLSWQKQQKEKERTALEGRSRGYASARIAQGLASPEETAFRMSKKYETPYKEEYQRYVSPEYIEAKERAKQNEERAYQLELLKNLPPDSPVTGALATDLLRKSTRDVPAAPPGAPVSAEAGETQPSRPQQTEADKIIDTQAILNSGLPEWLESEKPQDIIADRWGINAENLDELNAFVSSLERLVNVDNVLPDNIKDTLEANATWHALIRKLESKRYSPDSPDVTDMLRRLKALGVYAGSAEPERFQAPERPSLPINPTQPFFGGEQLNPLNYRWGG